MAGIFDKVKRGVSDASAKAKTAMDVSKLKSQITQLENHIVSEYQKIGMAVFKGYGSPAISTDEEIIANYCGSIAEKMKQIELLQGQIRLLNDEKDCPGCQKVVAADTRFCPGCGFKLNGPLPVSEE